MSTRSNLGPGSKLIKRHSPSGTGGAATAFMQGGGNKKSGLISTKNRAINGAMVRHIRTRADGGNTRHWVFCMNQLGGVGRKWGQAAGPGNRGGVSGGCAALAAQSRCDFPVGNSCSLTPAQQRALKAVAALKTFYECTTYTSLTAAAMNVPTSIIISAVGAVTFPMITLGVTTDLQRDGTILYAQGVGRDGIALFPNFNAGRAGVGWARGAQVFGPCGSAGQQKCSSGPKPECTVGTGVPEWGFEVPSIKLTSDGTCSTGGGINAANLGTVTTTVFFHDARFHHHHHHHHHH